MVDGQVDQELEKEARSMGWDPEFKGEKFITAAEFVEKGKSIMPILQKNNERLQNTIRQQEGKLGAMEHSLKAANAAIEALQASHDEDTRAQVEAARAALKDELAAASEAGDHKGVADATAKLVELGAAEDKAEVKPKGNGKDQQQQQQQQELHPEVKDWMGSHSDFMSNQRKVALANVVAAELRSKGDTRVGKAFLDDVQQEVEETLAGGKKRGGDGKVLEGAGGGDQRGADSKKTYSDLPKEAKDACDSLAKKLVGPNRAHKDLASWRTSYVKQYFE